MNIGENNMNNETEKFMKLSMKIRAKAALIGRLDHEKALDEEMVSLTYENFSLKAREAFQSKDQAIVITTREYLNFELFMDFLDVFDMGACVKAAEGYELQVYGCTEKELDDFLSWMNDLVSIRGYKGSDEY